MLDTIRQYSRSTIIYVLFGVIIVVFVFTFNTGGGGGQSCGSSGEMALATVAGDDIDNGTLYMGMVLSVEEPNPLDNSPDAFQKKMAYERFRFPQIVEEPRFHAFVDPARVSPLKFERVMSDLVETYLVSDAARGMGLYIDREALQARMYSERWKDESGRFQVDQFKNYVQFGLRASLVRYEAFLEREMMRERVVDAVTSGVVADAAEVAFYDDLVNRKANAMFIEISPRLAARTVSIDQAAIDEALAKRDADVKAWYEGHKQDFQLGTSFQFIGVRLAHADGDAAQVKDRAEAALVELTKLSEAQQDARLAELARQLSSHQPSKARGGLMPSAVNEKALAKAPYGEPLLAALQVLSDGQLGPVVEVADAAWIVKRVSSQDEGVMPYEQAKVDAARRLLQQDKGDEAAEALAKETAAWIKAHATARIDKVASFLETRLGEPVTTNETGAFARMSLYQIGRDAKMTGGIPRIGRSSEIMKQVFSLTTEKPLGVEVHKVETSGRYFVVELKSMTALEGDEAAEARKLVAGELEARARRDVYAAWYSSLLEVAQRDGGVSYSADYQRILEAERARYQQIMQKAAEAGGMSPQIKLSPSGS
jgi:peptidyl-prolyl cis-trans isomerase D